jgi:hypothetical protein
LFFEDLKGFNERIPCALGTVRVANCVSALPARNDLPPNHHLSISTSPRIHEMMISGFSQTRCKLLVFPSSLMTRDSKHCATNPFRPSRTINFVPSVPDPPKVLLLVRQEAELGVLESDRCQKWYCSPMVLELEAFQFGLHYQMASAMVLPCLEPYLKQELVPRVL